MSDVKVDWPFDKDQQKTAAKENLKEVKHVIAIASGKGGVGKSTLTAQLARALSQKGYAVGILDADFYGPSIPWLFGGEDGLPPVNVDDQERILPPTVDGIKLLSIGYMIPPEKALIWRAPMITNALKQFFTEVNWGRLDYLLIDLPPGTGDIHITIAQSVPLDGVLMVSTPQQLSVADVRKAIQMFNDPHVQVPILGLIENMAYFEPEDHPKRYRIFGEGGVERLAEETHLPILASLPIAPNSSQFEMSYSALIKAIENSITEKTTK